MQQNIQNYLPDWTSKKHNYIYIYISDEIQVVLETDTSNGDICRSGKSNDNFLFHGQGATNSAQAREQ